jgi:hypothetical protein
VIYFSMKDNKHHCWAEAELRRADLGDRRLNRRLARLVGDLAAHPAATVPLACGSWPATKAAYRFGDNEHIAAQGIRDAHLCRTRQRLPRDGATIVAIQDTTVLNFSHHPATRDLGYLSALEQRGLLVPSTLAVAADGVPLGLLQQQVWARADADFGKRPDRRHKETAAKESQRWLNAVRDTEQALPLEQAVLTVADREGDFYDLFATPRRPGHDLLIRAKSRRRIKHAARLLGYGIATSPARGQLRVKLPRAHGRPGRRATLTLRWGTFAIEPPSTHPRRTRLPALPLTVVLAQEESPPKGITAVRWLLLTTRKVSRFADVVQLVRWYAKRWLIEVTFENSKQFLGLEDPANRLPLAVQRTAPMALVLYSLIVVWFHRVGHEWVRFPDRPWYAKKAEPSFADLLSTLRRVSWEERFQQVRPGSSPHHNLLAQRIDFVSRTG